jgi:hypothetical protein
MSGQSISQELKKFIKEQIHSVFSLEVLLLLHRAQSRSFTDSEVADELGLEIDIAQKQLSELASARLLAPIDIARSKYIYQPVEDLGFLVDQLAAAYSRQRVPILSLILAEHPDKIRGFAEAFRLIGNE